jgi:hypothetical protein
VKKVLILATLAAFLAAASWVFSKEGFMVYCCYKGKCERVTKPACPRLGGTIVQNCGQCK